jgi:hypothetical protein
MTVSNNALKRAKDMFFKLHSSGGSGMNRSKLFLAKPLLAGLALAASNLVVAPAQAQGLLDIGRVILGLPTEEKEPIEYRERAPLVVPPTQNLRPPSEAAASRRTNWPQDPDVLERRKAAEEARRPRSTDSITARDPTSGRRLTVDEIRAGRVAGQEVVREPETGNLDIVQRQSNVFGGLSALRELDRRSSSSSEANLAREEPRREFLTDPPKGLRQPSDRAAFKATREGSLGVQKEPSPFDIFKEGPNTR